MLQEDVILHAASPSMRRCTGMLHWMPCPAVILPSETQLCVRMVLCCCAASPSLCRCTGMLHWMPYPAVILPSETQLCVGMVLCCCAASPSLCRCTGTLHWMPCPAVALPSETQLCVRMVLCCMLPHHPCTGALACFTGCRAQQYPAIYISTVCTYGIMLLCCLTIPVQVHWHASLDAVPSSNPAI
jgi:hypothetical protein